MYETKYQVWQNCIHMEIRGWLGTVENHSWLQERLTQWRDNWLGEFQSPQQIYKIAVSAQFLIHTDRSSLLKCRITDTVFLPSAINTPWSL
jgi:hypothetical protein